MDCRAHAIDGNRRHSYPASSHAQATLSRRNLGLFLEENPNDSAG